MALVAGAHSEPRAVLVPLAWAAPAALSESDRAPAGPSVCSLLVLRRGGSNPQRIQICFYPKGER